MSDLTFGDHELFKAIVFNMFDLQGPVKGQIYKLNKNVQPIVPWEVVHPISDHDGSVKWL